jgi:hypothetical protein
MYALLFLVHPFTMLLVALRSLRGRHLPNVLWAFTIFYSMSIGLEKDSTSDIVRYIAQVEQLHHSTFTLQTAYEYYINSGEVDIIRTVLSILISRFTDNGYILVILFGVLFGFFFSRNITFVICRLDGGLKAITLLLLFILFLLVPFWEINGFRFWTATHVFLFGLLPFVFDGNKRRLIWCVITPFVFHFSFLIPLVVLAIFLLVGNRHMLLFGFFVFSIFFSEINLDRLNNVTEKYVPRKFADRSANYRTYEAVERYQEWDVGVSWHARYYRSALHWSLCMFLIVLYWKSRHFIFKDRRMLRLLSFIFLMYGVANFLSKLPSGGRFVTLASMLTVAFLIVYIQNNHQERLMRQLIPWTYPLLILFVVVATRIGFYQMSITTLFGNPFIAMFTIGENIPLEVFIK